SAYGAEKDWGGLDLNCGNYNIICYSMNCLSNMKRSFRSLLIPAACVFLVTGNLPTGVAGEVDGAFPVGWLQVTTSGLVIGTRPNMSWKVVPSTIESQVQLASSGRFSLLRDALMAVRVVGVS